MRVCMFVYVEKRMSGGESHMSTGRELMLDMSRGMKCAYMFKERKMLCMHKPVVFVCLFLFGFAFLPYVCVCAMNE